MTIQKILLRFPPEKKNILRAIKAVNESFGWVSGEAIGMIARYFGISESQVFSTASFYDEIYLERKPLVVVEVCDGSNCHSKNSDKIINKVESYFKIKEGKADKNFGLKRMSCTGRCLEGPVVRVNGKFYLKMTGEKTIRVIQDELGL